VNYSLSGTAQNGSDYQQLAASVTIPAGSSSATITVTPIDDSSVETDETVRAHPFGHRGLHHRLASSATITIADNDQPRPVNQSSRCRKFVPRLLRRRGRLKASSASTEPATRSQPIQVNWTFSGTAANGSDFEELPTTSPFPAGLAEADLTITPIDDSVVEGDETVIVTLVAGPGYTVGSPSSATITIADNDQPPPPTPTVTVVASDATASETGDTGAFTVSRTGGTASALTVNYALSGTAQNGSDYQQLAASVTIPAASSSATITVTPSMTRCRDRRDRRPQALGRRRYTIGSRAAQRSPSPTTTSPHCRLQR